MRLERLWLSGWHRWWLSAIYACCLWNRRFDNAWILRKDRWSRGWRECCFPLLQNPVYYERVNIRRWCMIKDVLLYPRLFRERRSVDKIVISSNASLALGVSNSCLFNDIATLKQNENAMHVDAMRGLTHTCRSVCSQRCTSESVHSPCASR